jgi:(p)ppGpp synthase/HD superfamily hydrolase
MVSEDNNWESNFKPCWYSDQLLNKLTLLNKTATSQIDIKEVKKAIHYAKVYHGTQIRESGEPYYTHPIAVADMFIEYTAQEKNEYFKIDLIITAILHDTIEDTKITRDIIESIFGTRIANQVESLTRIKDGYKVSSTDTLNDLFLKKEYGLAIVKTFDRIHNLQTLGVKSPEKAKKIIEETIESFISLSIYLETSTIEKELIRLCYKYLSTPGIVLPKIYPKSDRPNVQRKPPMTLYEMNVL